MMLKLLKPFPADGGGAGGGGGGDAAPLWPAAAPGEGVLPFEVSLERAILEALAAAGGVGASTEELQGHFCVASKLMGKVLQRLKALFKVPRCHFCNCRFSMSSERPATLDAQVACGPCETCQVG